MMTTSLRAAVAAGLVALVIGGTGLAHEMLVRGTVAGIESARIQVKTAEEKDGQPPAWFAIDAKTRILRGKTVVSFEQAKIVVGERVVLNVDHQANGTMKTLEIHLAAR